MIYRLQTLVLAVSALVSPAQAVCGDCNQDGTLSILDALTGAQAGAGLLTLSPSQMLDCDVDASLTVDVLDALRLAQSAAGLVVVLSCPAGNQPPALSWDWVPPIDAGLVPLYYSIADAESDTVDVSFEHSTDAGTSWRPMVPQTGLSIVTYTSGLTTSPAGSPQIFLWDAWQDAPAVAGPVQVRAWAEDSSVGPVSMATIDLRNATVTADYTAECIPLSYGSQSLSDVQFYAVAKNLRASPTMVEFNSSCQFHYSLDGGSYSSMSTLACLFVITGITIPAGGVHEWPLYSHSATDYYLPPGLHFIAVQVMDTLGTQDSSPQRIEVR